MKKILFFTLAASLLLASCGQKDVTTDSANTSVPVEQAKQELVAEDKTVLAANFEVYNEGSLWETENTVIFFHQESCGTCKATEASLIESWVPADLKVLKVDIDADSSTELKKKYGVTMKHTFVSVDAEGNMIKKWNGSKDLADIQEQISEDAMMEKEEAVMEDKMEKQESMEKEDAMEKEVMSDDKMEKEDAMMKKDEAVMEDKMEKTEEVMEAKTEEVAAPTVALAGTYAAYDSSLVGNTEKTVLFFHAAWCPSCVAADKGITAGNVPDGLTVLKADFDTSTDLRKKYGVVSQHTFVQVDADGAMINKWTGWNSIDDIVEKL